MLTLRSSSGGCLNFKRRTSLLIHALEYIYHNGRSDFRTERTLKEVIKWQGTILNTPRKSSRHLDRYDWTQLSADIGQLVNKKRLTSTFSTMQIALDAD